MKESFQIFKGNIIFTKTPEKFETIENGYIIVKNGKVQEIFSTLPEEYKNYIVTDYSDKLIIPGFIDLHCHAPQFENRGIGLDKELIPWLETYTFKEEEKFHNIDYAKKIYKNLAKSLKKNGTTRAVLFSSIHLDGTRVLFEEIVESGIGAYIGKVNMDRNCPDYLCENTEVSIDETLSIIKEFKDKYPFVKPIITPRFVPTCSDKMLKELGNLAKEYNLKIQSHLSENPSEVEWVESLHPSTKKYGKVYDEFGLLKENDTIMAHCVYSNQEEINLLKEKGVYVAHCPASNANLSSGIAPIKEMIKKGLNVGLGSDISGGHDISISKVMVLAVQLSKMKWATEGRTGSFLSTPEAFFLATKGGGKFFGKVGSFEKGYEFDALVIDDSSLSDSSFSLEERVQKFIYIGDDRNIMKSYVSGNELI